MSVSPSRGFRAGEKTYLPLPATPKETPPPTGTQPRQRPRRAQHRVLALAKLWPGAYTLDRAPSHSLTNHFRVFPFPCSPPPRREERRRREKGGEEPAAAASGGSRGRLWRKVGAIAEWGGSCPWERCLDTDVEGEHRSAGVGDVNTSMPSRMPTPSLRHLHRRPPVSAASSLRLSACDVEPTTLTTSPCWSMSCHRTRARRACLYPAFVPILPVGTSPPRSRNPWSGLLAHKGHTFA
jgi:hypothetical protein